MYVFIIMSLPVHRPRVYHRPSRNIGRLLELGGRVEKLSLTLLQFPLTKKGNAMKRIEQPGRKFQYRLDRLCGKIL